VVGTASLLVWISARVWPSHLDRQLEPLARCRARRGDEDMQFDYQACNLCRGGGNNWEERILSPEGQHPKYFQAPNNDIKYDSKTNLTVWLEDYCLTCKLSGANNILFIIQLLPIYLADSARAWPDHLPRNTLDSWEDVRRSSLATSTARMCDPATHVT
jgi:hypothetical protein